MPETDTSTILSVIHFLRPESEKQERTLLKISGTIPRGLCSSMWWNWQIELHVQVL